MSISSLIILIRSCIPSTRERNLGEVNIAVVGERGYPIRKIVLPFRRRITQFRQRNFMNLSRNQCCSLSVCSIRCQGFFEGSTVCRYLHGPSSQIIYTVNRHQTHLCLQLVFRRRKHDVLTVCIRNMQGNASATTRFSRSNRWFSAVCGRECKIEITGNIGSLWSCKGKHLDGQ